MGSRSKNALQIDQLCVEFPLKHVARRKSRTVLRAVDRVDLTVGDGEIVGLVGESGSGKSTVARSVVGLDRATSGEVTLFGTTVFRKNHRYITGRRRLVQMIFQDPAQSVNRFDRVYRILEEPLLARFPSLTSSERRESMEQMMEAVGLSKGSLKKFPRDFSGGQLQRICIGRALLAQPKLIIADEAVSGLDVSVQAQILNLLADLHEELQFSMLFISHDLAVIEYLCQRVYVMNSSRVVESGETLQVFRNPATSYTKTLLEARPLIEN